MFIKCLTVGRFEANCYIVCDKITNRAAVIDPGYDAPRIYNALAETGCAVDYIFLTHCHWDHVDAAHEIQEKTGAKLAVFGDEVEALNDKVKNLYSTFAEESFRPFLPDLILHDGDTVQVGKMEFRVLHTPGHTPGAICLICGDSLFTGDTLFRENIGAIDLPGGNLPQLLETLKKIAALEGEYQIFPGHGEYTTLSHEREYNPYLKVGDKAE